MTTTPAAGGAVVAAGVAMLLVGMLTDVEVLSPVLVLAGPAAVLVGVVQLLQGRRGRG